MGKKGIPTAEQLLKAAVAPDRNKLTKAGRALQKHSGRPDSSFTASSQQAKVLNMEGEQLVARVLNNPARECVLRSKMKNKIEVVCLDIRAPNGLGIHFNLSNFEFSELFEP